MMNVTVKRIASWLTVLGLVAIAHATAHAQPADKSDKKAEKNATKLIIDRVVAVVNNQVILQSELATRVLPLAGDLQNIADRRERARREKKLTLQMLEDMISEELIVQAAKEAKVQVQAKEIAAAVEEIKKQNNLDDDGLAQALAMQGFTVATYKKDVKRQIMRMRAINMLVRPRVTVTDEDVRARYDEMTRRSSSVSKVHLKHILLGLPPKPSEQQVSAAKARAAKLIEQVKGGAKFDDLARQHSNDAATRAGGGDLGWIERGSLATEWEVVIFSMEKGEVRGPVSGPTGLHVFYVEDVKRSDLKPFEELKEQLRNDLYRKEMDKQTGLWLEELRKKAFIDRKL